MGFADVPAPMQYGPRENLGVSLVGGLGQIAGAIQQADAAQSTKEFQTAFGQAYAKGDYNAMQQLASNHPEQWQQVQQGMTAIQQNNRDQLGAASSDISLAAASGNPQAILNVAQRHASTLQGLGIAPEDLANAYQQNPQQVKQYADMLGSHALGPEKYFTLQNQTLQRIQNGSYQQGQLNLGQQRLQQQQDYQNNQLQQGQQRLNLDAQMNQAKMLDMQVNRQLQAGKNSADIQAKQATSLQTKQTLVDQWDQQNNNLANMFSTLNSVQGFASADPEHFNGMFGASGKINRNIPGSVEQANWGQIQQMQGQARLMGVIGMKGTGPVSDAEGQAAAKSFLALDESTSAAAARKAINNWNAVLQRQAQYQRQHQPQIDLYRQQISNYTAQQQQQLNPQQQPQSGYSGSTGGAVNWNQLK